MQKFSAVSMVDDETVYCKEVHTVQKYSVFPRQRVRMEGVEENKKGNSGSEICG